LSPLSKKTTGKITLNLFKSYDSDVNKLSNQILTTSTVAPNSLFKSGELSMGKFTSANMFVQSKASHTISFKLKNDLPGSVGDFNSRIVIKMPSLITASDDTPTLKDLTGLFSLPQIKRETDFEDCGLTSGKPICYSVTHSNKKALPGNTELRFRISGSIN
jgi:hypothetical protein